MPEKVGVHITNASLTLAGDAAINNRIAIDGYGFMQVIFAIGII